MKIYFAGSIRGGREDLEFYKELINYLRNFGEVLTEHIGDPNLSSSGEEIKEIEIFKRDVKWITDCDLVIAEVTRPSLGVGYEIALSQTLGKPILCLYRPENGKKLSAMIEGLENVKKKYYENLNEAKEEIKIFIENL